MNSNILEFAATNIRDALAGITLRVHTFNDTGEAYDACQCDEGIKEGDVLLIPSEKVAGVAHTWPCAVTREPGKLHQLKAGYLLEMSEAFNAGWIAACAEAKRAGWEVE
jgi:hypothetical protein